MFYNTPICHIFIDFFLFESILNDPDIDCVSVPSSELLLFAGMLEYDPVKRFSIQRIRQHK